MANILMSDIDGVIADPSDQIKRYLMRWDKPDWKGFFSDTYKVKPVNNIITLITFLRQVSWEIVFVTGRPETNRRATTNWLVNNTDFLACQPPVHLIMRRAGDIRPGTDIKLEVAKRIKPTLILEDELFTCRTLSNNGFCVCQVHGHRVEIDRPDRIPE